MTTTATNASAANIRFHKGRTTVTEHAVWKRTITLCNEHEAVIGEIAGSYYAGVKRGARRGYCEQCDKLGGNPLRGHY